MLKLLVLSFIIFLIYAFVNHYYLEFGITTLIFLTVSKIWITK